MKQPSNKVVQEWMESEVTEYVKSLFAKNRDECFGLFGLDSYVMGEPQKTQEILAQLSAAADTWDLAIEALEGDFLEIEDGE